MDIRLPLDVYVRPNKPKTKLVGYDKEKKCYIIEVKAKPKNNQANIELIKFLRKLTGKHIVIQSGKTSRRKVFLAIDEEVV